MSLPSLTDAEYRTHRARIRRLADKWIKPLGLNWWHVQMQFSREPLPTAEGDAANNWHTVAQAKVKWQYLKACITFNMLAVSELDDDDLEAVFVHELCHVFVNEMREWEAGGEGSIDHEERVVTQLTSAFIWVRQRATSDARRKKSNARPKAKRKR